METEKYSLLKDFNVDIEVEDEEYMSFFLCFWVYLLNSTTFPSTIIRQVHSAMNVSAPFLVLDENENLMLLPLSLLHREAPDPVNTASWVEVPNVSTNATVPLERWFHVGCEVSRHYIRLHINGEIVGEQGLTSLLTKDINLESPGKISLFSVGGDGYSVQGFIHGAEVLPTAVPMKYHYVKDPPLWLSVQKPLTSGIEIGEDGVWSIIDGQASCQLVFSLDVVLCNAVGQLVHKDVEVMASLLYANSKAPVEKTPESEATLFASYGEGVEFSACNRPIKLLNGRASFKLMISQLSSKSEKKVFFIKFQIPKIVGYPFLEAVTNPIRCVPRNCDVEFLLATSKRVNHIDHPLDRVPTLVPCNGSSLKRVRLEERLPGSEDPVQQNNPRSQTSSQFVNGNGVSMERPQHHEEEDSSTGSDYMERDSNCRRYTITDKTVFRYCLGNFTERSLLLKEIISNSSDEEISEFADKISLYSGCSHHSNQIKMARKLISEGTTAWRMISKNNQHVHWDSAIFEIEEHFMRIAQCSSRSLTQQDFELLRRIAGCYDYMTQENFEKLWCWLFPVAHTVSQGLINGVWSSMSPKWIEGFITKEEADHSLQGQEPGTFILRFPTSRSWPHPDAGSLVVTYVGHDFVLHHRLLTTDHICNQSYKDVKPLQEMLLAEPGLSRLGRIIRSH